MKVKHNHRLKFLISALSLMLLLSALMGLHSMRDVAASPNGDGNIHWDELYHNAPAAHHPETELVPGESYPFRNVRSDGWVDFHILCDWQDLDSANIVWQVEADGWQDHWTPLSWVKNIEGAFHEREAFSGKYDLWTASVDLSAYPDGTQVYYYIQVNDHVGSSPTRWLKTSGGYLNPLGQHHRDTQDRTEGNWGFTTVNTSGGPPGAHDNNVHWNELYHNAPADYNPDTETVPGQSYAFRVVNPDGTANLTMLALAGDLTSANVIWEASTNWGQHNWLALTHIGTVENNFHNKGTFTYDIWRATIPAQSANTAVYYRFQASDGTATAYLKNSAGDLLNPLGQWVWGSDNPTQGNWGYTIGGDGPPPTPPPTPGPTPTPLPPVLTDERTVFVHLFEWKWADIALECENFLGPMGYSAVQVSPPQEHRVISTNNYPWWQRYQPISYELISRSGDRAAFIDMVERCHNVGVDIYVDAVINHMTGLPNNTSTSDFGGSSGSNNVTCSITSGNNCVAEYPAVPYGANDFNLGACNHNIVNWDDPWEARMCELLGLDDLKTSDAAVRVKIADFLNDLIDIGIAGFRIDAAKHMYPADLVAIKSLLHNRPAEFGGDPAYIFQEVIQSQLSSGDDYLHIGHVTEFRYSNKVGSEFHNGGIAWLQGIENGKLPSYGAVVFTDNHDNQRGHGGGGGPVTHKEPELYKLANVFMLAYPYGYPKVMSSYYFSNGDQGPPSDGSGNTYNIYVNEQPTGCSVSGGWACEHRWPEIANMVAFRNFTLDNFYVTDWWSNGFDQIAFGRGNAGFVIINRSSSNALNRTFQTSLAPGEYCNVISGGLFEGRCTGQTVTVNANGTINASVGAMKALAIHIGARPGMYSYPTVSILSPANGATVEDAFTVVVTATHTNPIAHVSLSVNGVSVGTVNAAPYTFILNAADYAPGTHTLYATATSTDTLQGSATSTFVVAQLPEVAIIAPEDGSVQTGTFWVTATATHPSGIARVDFYVDGALIGSDNTPTARPAPIQRALTQAPLSKTIDGQTGDWDISELIASDHAHNSAQVAAPCTSGPYCRDGHTWSTHERQVDFVGLFADWDAEYLYVGIQGADVIDIEDPVNANSGDFVNTWNMIMFIGLDTAPGGYGEQPSGDMWGKPQHFAGTNQLNYQVYFASNFWQGPFLRQHNGSMWDAVDTGPGTAAAGLYGKSSRGNGTSFVTGTPVIGPNGRDYIADGYNQDRSTFWEVRIPLNLIGNPDLDNGCIELFVGHGDYSSIDSIPDDPATRNTPGVSDSNSPLEWSDRDIYTAPFAKVGNGTECGSAPATHFSIELDANDYDAGTHDLEARAISHSGPEASAYSTFIGLNGPSLRTSTKTAEPTVAYAGETLTYTITLHNTGNEAASVMLTDTLSTNVTVVPGSLPAGMTQTGNQLTWSGPVNAGASASLSFQVTVNAGVRNVTVINRVDINDGAGRVTTQEASTAILASGPNLSTSTKAVSAGTAVAGDTLDYTIALRNTGNQSASVVLTDTLPAGVTVVGALPAGMTQIANKLYWNGTVNAGATTTLNFQVEIDPGVEGVTLVNAVQINDGAGSVVVRQASTTVPSAGPCGGALAGDGSVVSSEMYHSNLDPFYRDPVGVAPLGQPATATLRTCRNDVSAVEVLVWETGQDLLSPTVYTGTVTNSGSHDYWRFPIPAPGTLVDQWYQFRITDGSSVSHYHPISGNDGPGRWYASATQENPSWSLPRGAGPVQPDCSGVALGDNDIRSSQLYHLDTSLTYRDPLGNLQLGESALLTLRACKGDVSGVTAWVWETNGGTNPNYTYAASVAYSDADFDYWQMTVPAPGYVIDQWYQFEVVDGAAQGYYHPTGNTGPGQWSSNPGSSWKLGTSAGPIGDVTDVPSWIGDAVIYQIFPDRFYNGDAINDPPPWTAGVTVYGPTTCVGYPHGRGSDPTCVIDGRSWADPLFIPSWGIDFHGGDLQGITQKINEGYFNDLGVNTLYLNPIFEASSNHGYDTNDFYTVRNYFGGNDAFEALLTAAQANGLRVILDAVFNHVGMDSIYLQDACFNSDSPYRAWFTPGTQNGGWACADGWGWKGWYGYETIPELVDDNADVRDFFFRGGSPRIPVEANGMSVAEYWIDKGIDGWRFDVAQDISQDWFREMRPYIKEEYGSADILILGEVTGGCASGGLFEAYTRGDQLDSVMNYCFRDWIAGFASGNNPEFFANSFEDFRQQYPPAIANAMMNLLSSHDSPRMLQMVSSDHTNLKLAVLLQMTLPGAPSVYYGDEIGMAGGHDPDNRRTYPWGSPPDPTMYAHFKKVIGIRNDYSALRNGEYERLLVADNVYAFARWDTDATIVVALRNVAGAQTGTLSVGHLFADGTVLTDVLNNNAPYTVNGGQINVTVSGKWGVILVGAGQAESNQAPHTPSTPFPTHTAANVSVALDRLQWRGGDPDNDTVTYTVYFGTSETPAAILGSVTGNTLLNLTTALDYGTTYYWQISASDGLSETVGPVWRFTTIADTPPVNQAPYVPSAPDPADEAPNVPVNPILSWTGGDPDGDAVTYTVAFGASNPPPVVAPGIAVAHYDPGLLTATLTYYWQITATDGLSETVGPVWRFTTGSESAPNRAPYPPSNPAPLDGATDVPTTTTPLAWIGGDPDPGDSVTYTVYFGAESPPPAVGDVVDVTTFDLTAALEPETTYYWQIVASDGLSETVGALWTFTTIAEPTAPSHNIYLPLILRSSGSHAAMRARVR